MPPCAAAKRPSRPLLEAPVKAPASCPKSSDSSRPSVRAAQLRATKGPSCRAERWWMARATTSLPTPDSPVMSTVVLGAAATLEIFSRSLWRLAEGPIRPSRPWSAWVSRKSSFITRPSENLDLENLSSYRALDPWTVPGLSPAREKEQAQGAPGERRRHT